MHKTTCDTTETISIKEEKEKYQYPRYNIKSYDMVCRMLSQSVSLIESH